MKVRTLQRTAELDSYARKVRRLIGVSLPPRYLARGSVLGLFTRGRLVGGVALIEAPPFRSILQLPAADRQRVERRVARLAGSIVELNGLFLLPNVQSAEAVLTFWAGLAEALRSIGASHFLFSYPSASARLRRFYSVLGAERLYHGEVQVIEGMRRADVECVELAQVASAMEILTSPGWLARRVSARLRPAVALRPGGPELAP